MGKTLEQNWVLAAAPPFMIRQFGDQQGSALHARIVQRAGELVLENGHASAARQRHLQKNILPLIAVYQVMQTAMLKEDALQLTGEMYLSLAYESVERIRKLLKLPLLHRAAPSTFYAGIKMMFNEAAGFQMNEYPKQRGVFRLDMTQCPYYDACVRYGYPELTQWFCKCDDITYGNMHQRLVWGRTKTIGLGAECCDFKLSIRGK